MVELVIMIVMSCIAVVEEAAPPQTPDEPPRTPGVYRNV